MKRVVLACLVPFLVSSASMAQEAKRVVLAAQLARSLDLEQTIDASKRQNAKLVSDEIAQLTSELRKIGMPEESAAEMGRFTEEVMRRVGNSWSTTEAARIYATEIADLLTEDEVIEAIEYYKSTDAKRTFEAIVSAQQKMSTYISDRTTAALKLELTDFIEKVKALAKNDAAKRKSK